MLALLRVWEAKSAPLWDGTGPPQIPELGGSSTRTETHGLGPLFPASSVVICPSIHKGSPSSEHFSVQSALMLNALRSLTPVPHFVLFCALLPTGQRPAAPSRNAYTGGRKYSHSCLPTSVGGWGAHRDNISGALFPPSHRGHVSQGTPEAFRHSTPIPIRHC